MQAARIPVSLETTVARLTNDCRASGGVATLRGQRVTRGAITKVLSLAAPELSLSLLPPLLPRPRAFFLCRPRNATALSSFNSVPLFLGEAHERPQKKRDLPVTLADSVAREREKCRWSLRRRRHAASLCARLRLGTLPRHLCAFPPPRTRMHLLFRYTGGVYKVGVDIGAQKRGGS